MKILTAPYILPISSELILKGALVIEGSEIIDVGPQDEIFARYPETSREDYPHHALLPGLINAHLHADMSFYKNYPSDPVRQSGVRVNFVDWLMGCLEYKRKSQMAHLMAATQWAIEECLRSGTTCVADMGNYEGIFQVVEKSGLRAVIFPEVFGFDVNVSKDLFESALALVEKYEEEDSPLISVGIGPYSAYTLSRNILRIISLYAKTSKMPVMMHVASSFSEMEFFHDSTGDIAAKLFPGVGWDEIPPPHQRTPIEHLRQIGFLDAKPLLVGCAQATDSDLDAIAKAKATIILTPRAAHFLHQGQADYARIKARDITVALGTDGIPSVDSLSMWDEMRAFIEIHSGKTNLTGREVLSLTTLQAAKALGLGDEIGSLERGKHADFLAVDITEVPPAGDFELNLVRRTREGQVEFVWVDGRLVKSLH